MTYHLINPSISPLLANVGHNSTIPPSDKTTAGLRSYRPTYMSCSTTTFRLLGSSSDTNLLDQGQQITNLNPPRSTRLSFNQRTKQEQLMLRGTIYRNQQISNKRNTKGVKWFSHEVTYIHCEREKEPLLIQCTQDTIFLRKLSRTSTTQQWNEYHLYTRLNCSRNNPQKPAHQTWVCCSQNPEISHWS